ncbi:hypothetical protein ACVRWB_05510 [Streptococcus troglodytae]
MTATIISGILARISATSGNNTTKYCCLTLLILVDLISLIVIGVSYFKTK